VNIQLLLNVPTTPREWTRWSFSHAQVHIAIRQALAALGAPTGDYILDPINPGAIEEWLSRVQQTHTEMNGPLGLQSSDLTGVDFNDEAQTVAWIYLNWQEDNAALQALKL
jgi:hypothetical protein